MQNKKRQFHLLGNELAFLSFFSESVVWAYRVINKYIIAFIMEHRQSNYTAHRNGINKFRNQKFRLSSLSSPDVPNAPYAAAAAAIFGWLLCSIYTFCFLFGTAVSGAHQTTKYFRLMNSRVIRYRSDSKSIVVETCVLCFFRTSFLKPKWIKYRCNASSIFYRSFRNKVTFIRDALGLAYLRHLPEDYYFIPYLGYNVVSELANSIDFFSAVNGTHPIHSYWKWT